MKNVSTALAVACIGLMMTSVCSAEVRGTCFLADKPFPEFMPLWYEGWQFKDAAGDFLVYAKPNMPLGGYMFVHFRNTSPKPIKVTDLLIEGIKMSEGLAQTKDDAGDLLGHSILVSKLPKEQIERLKNAGHPMWWKTEPVEVQPGEMGQVVVRMRRVPKTAKVNVGVETSGGVLKSSVAARKPQPRFAGINFSEDLRVVYLYPRHPKPEMEPERVLMDGRDVTARCEAVADKSLDVSPIVLSLDEPLKMMSYHCFEAVYPDKSSAMAGIRTWGSDIVYGMWGSRGDARECLTDWTRHNINVQMGMAASKEITDLSLNKEGFEFLKSLGMRQMATTFGNARRPIFYFLQDEPDAQDPGISDLPPDQRLGLVGQYLVDKMNKLRAKDPNTPILLNIDNTYKPENWYMYHQLSDIPCLDPYYQAELDFTYWHHPGGMAAHYKPTYVYAAATISQSSGAPKPMHVLLCSTKYEDKAAGLEGRFPTPEDIRIQVYYILAAGAKGLSYWWFSPGSGCIGCGADDPAAKALYNEIGILGAEVRTAGPVVTVSCPAALPVEASRWLWVRTLISGADTVAVIVTNDNILCDRVGAVYKPVEKARVSVTLPVWLNPRDAFEISCRGVTEATWKQDGKKVGLDLGTVELSRFIVITADTGLKAWLSKLYQEKFAANTAELLARRK